jgi:hypothetical protein
MKSAAATIWRRTNRTNGCLSRDGVLLTMFKIACCAEYEKLRSGATYAAFRANNTLDSQHESPQSICAANHSRIHSFGLDTS